MCPETPIRTAAYVSVPHLFPMHIVRSCVLKMSDLSGANWWCVRNRSSTALFAASSSAQAQHVATFILVVYRYIRM